MVELNLSNGLLSWLITASLRGTTLIVVILLIQWLYRRWLAARWRFGLWWLVILPFPSDNRNRCHSRLGRIPRAGMSC